MPCIYDFYSAPLCGNPRRHTCVRVYNIGFQPLKESFQSRYCRKTQRLFSEIVRLEYLYTIFFNGSTAEISNNMAQWLLTAAAAQQLPGRIFAATAQEPASWLVLGATAEPAIPKTADLTCTCTLKQARQALAVAAPGSACFLYGDDGAEAPWAQVQQDLTKKNCAAAFYCRKSSLPQPWR